MVTLFVLAFGIFEETPLTSTPPYAQSAAIYHSDDAFVHHIQAVAGRSASIFELPYERLPALVAGEGSQYANIIGYVHSRTLKWSYGSFPGRPQDWQSSLVVQPLSLVLPSIVAAGFTGIQVDRAYAAPPQLASILAALSSLPHSNGFTSGDGHFAFVDLTAYAQALERQLGPGLATLRAATLHPLTTEYGAGFFWPHAGPNDPRWAGRTAILTIHNPASHAQSATYSAILKTGTLPIRGADRLAGGASTRLQVTGQGTRVVRTIDFPPGASTIRFSTDAPPAQDAPGDTRILNLNVSAASLASPTAGPFVGPRAGPFRSLSVLGLNGLST